MLGPQLFPRKAHRAQTRGTAPLSTCPPPLSPRRLLVQQHFAFCGAAAGQNQQTEFSFFSPPLLPEAARESEVFFFSLKLDKCLQQVRGISAAQFGHNDSDAFVMHVGKHDSVYSESENCTLRQNSVYICGLGADDCTHAALGINLSWSGPSCFQSYIQSAENTQIKIYELHVSKTSCTS